MTRPFSPVCCALLAACATESPHDRAFVAQQIVDRSGATIRPATTTELMPPGTQLADGLTEAEAVAIALWNHPGFQAALTDLDVRRAELAGGSVPARQRGCFGRPRTEAR